MVILWLKNITFTDKEKVPVKTYLDALKQVYTDGVDSTDRTGTGTRRLIGLQHRYPVTCKSFPLVTTKRVFWKAVVGELLWFLEGSTNRNRLEELTHGTIGEKSTIWDEWADPIDGKLGPIYGAQWRNWNSRHEYLPLLSEHISGLTGFKLARNQGIDQIANLIQGIKDSPDSRRHIVSAWNPEQLDNMALPPCHTLWQVLIADDGFGTKKLNLMLYQRSADMFLGVPFNIASYSLLLLMLAQVTGYAPGEFIHTIGDAHIYHNHLNQVGQQLKRHPMPAPGIRLNPEIKSILVFKPEDITLKDYDPWPAIQAPVAV